VSTFYSVNPATGAKLKEYAIAGAGEVDAALSAAARAFEQLLQHPPRWQAGLLDAIAANIMDLGDALLEQGEQETALPRPRLTGERARTVNQLKMFAEIVRDGSWVDAVIDTAQPQRQPMPRPDIRRMYRPRGPVVVFGPSNFPFAFGVCGGDTGSALAAGCPVVVKGHPSHPGTNALFASAVNDAVKKLKLPTGTFALLQGKSHELGNALAKHPATTAIGFTGSLRGGRALMDAAAARPRPIPVYAEMGSLNPLVILPGAMNDRRDAIATGLAGSILLGLGQFCTKPGLIFVLGEPDDFIAALVMAIGATAGGAMLNAGLRDAFCARAGEFAKATGVTTLVNGSPSAHAAMSPSLWETSVQNWLANHALAEEAFGPGALIIRCRDERDVVSCLDRIEGSLTATLHLSTGDDQQLAARLLAKMQNIAGRVIVNGYPTGVEVCNAIVHGGPYPAMSESHFTSVGSAAILRWVRLIAFQDTPDALLPPELQNPNPLGIERTVNGARTRGAI
jgi:NADP-dependent aldehyde dehydrogenase